MVVPNEVYHIKLAIADVADYILDSGVFLEAGSFRSFGDQVVVLDDHFSPAINREPGKCQNIRVHSREINPRQLNSLNLPEVPSKLALITRKQFNIQFDFNSFDISPVYTHQLRTLSEVVQYNPQAIVKIIGHTDNIGSRAYNQKLSAKRSRAVASYLMNQGVESSRIKTLFFGETQPRYANSTAYGRTLNRRVEFVLELETELNANYGKPELVEN
jgi:outer membrane protein OmpA-like peptidoglycan-associated protein